jgi:uncharacterized protein (DUF342 family)
MEEQHIVTGILDDELEKLVEEQEGWTEPIVVAKGTEPVPGDPGYIFPVLKEEQAPIDLNAQFIDLRSPTFIQSVKKGDEIARIVHHTEGINGINVKGEVVKAKPGKPIRVKKTKYVRIDEQENTIHALTDGQVSYQKRAVHVFPVYEVQGDLDLKTGNLTFTGNIHIFGDVPSGYSISADGDIRIQGSVEASQLKAGGSIFIRDGIASQGRGLIQAGCDVRTGYINQGSIRAGGDLHASLINHSTIQVDGNVFCQNGKGLIHGGTITTGGNVHVIHAGNELMTRTKFFFGIPPHVLERHDNLQQKIGEEEQNVLKLKALDAKIEQKPLDQRTIQERLLQLKVKNTLQQSIGLLNQLTSEYELVKEDFVEVKDLSMFIKGEVHSGVEVTFGKYTRSVKSELKAVELKLHSGEIIMQPLKES